MSDFCVTLIIIAILFNRLYSQSIEDINRKLDSLYAVQKENKAKIDAIKESLNLNSQQIEKYQKLKASLQGSTATETWFDPNDPKYIRLSKLYNNEIAARLMNKELWEGMSQGMVIESIGKPDGKTTKNTDSGIEEDWNYSDRILHLENGELKKWLKK